MFGIRYRQWLKNWWNVDKNTYDCPACYNLTYWDGVDNDCHMCNNGRGVSLESIKQWYSDKIMPNRKNCHKTNLKTKIEQNLADQTIRKVMNLLSPAEFDALKHYIINNYYSEDDY